MAFAIVLPCVCHSICHRFAIFAILGLLPTTARTLLARFTPLPALGIHFVTVRLIVSPIMEHVFVLVGVILPQARIAEFLNRIIGATEHGNHVRGDTSFCQLLRGPRA